GDFHPRDHFHPGANRGGAGCGDGPEGVVVGDGQGGQAAAPGEVHDLGGGVGAVAVGGVQVQVGAAGVTAAGGQLTQGGEGLACRHGSGARGGPLAEAVEDAVDEGGRVGRAVAPGQ